MASVGADCAPICPCFGLLPPHMSSAAQQLADIARSGRLSLFIGAGVSIGAGLPDWLELLQIIEDDFTASGAPSERQLGDRNAWDTLNMADELAAQADAGPDRSGLRQNLKPS